MNTIVHTDGGCWGNPGPGGWACIISWDSREVSLSGGEEGTTNNRMELTAVIKALEYIAGNEQLARSRVEIHTDSQYVQKGITQWIEKWKKNGWKTANKKPVKNKSLWEALDSLKEILSTEWHWVKGHAGNSANEACDGMVQEAIAAVKAKREG